MFVDDLKWTVYMHVNKTNGKVYVGITHDIHKRWRGSGCAYKSNQHFWQAIQKYGWNGFGHEVIFSGLTMQEACEREIELIAKYESTDRSKGYNHSSGGEFPLVFYKGEQHPRYGKHHSDESRAKMSASHSGEKHRCWGKHLPEITRKRIGDANRGRKLPEWQKEHLRAINTGRVATEETKQKMSRSQQGHPVSEETKQRIRETKVSKPILQLTIAGEILNEWPSVTSAEQANGLDRSQIRKCCKGELKTSGGFAWAYADELDNKGLLLVSEDRKPLLIEEGKRMGDAKQRKEVLQTTLEGDVVKKWSSLTQAAKENGILVSSICQCCKGVNQTAGGYKWQYVNSIR